VGEWQRLLLQVCFARAYHSSVFFFVCDFSIFNSTCAPARWRESEEFCGID
jgi:hypothetical protein